MGIAMPAARVELMERQQGRKRLILRCLSFGLLGLTLATLLLAGSDGSPDRLFMTVWPDDTLGGLSPRALLLGAAAISLVGCIAAEMLLRRSARQQPGRIGD
jgi:hypothetical protein